MTDAPSCVSVVFAPLRAPMYRVLNPSARIALLYLVPPVSVDEARRAAGELQALLKRNAPRKTVVCSDVRASAAWAEDTANVFIGMMRADNPLLERSGIFYTEGGSMGLQVMRMIREAGLEERRFGTHDPAALVRWFAEILDATELEHVRRFVYARKDVGESAEPAESMKSVQERMMKVTSGPQSRRNPKG